MRGSDLRISQTRRSLPALQEPRGWRISLPLGIIRSRGKRRLFGQDFGGRFGHGFVQAEQIHGGPRRSAPALLPILKSAVADAEHGRKGALRDPRLLAQGSDVLAGEEALSSVSNLLSANRHFA
jgi:hypothetical protein